MIDFLCSAQLNKGELPYTIRGPFGKGLTHFHCYQYNAFELQDLAMYYEATLNDAILPLIKNLAKFVSQSVKDDGSTQFNCTDSRTQIIYNTAAIAAALMIARRMGLHNALEAENRAFIYILSQQHINGDLTFLSKNMVIYKTNDNIRAL